MKDILTRKEKFLWFIWEHKYAMNRSLERLEQEFKAIDPVIYAQLKEKYNLHFEPACIWPDEYSKRGFSVKISYNKQKFKFISQVDEFKIQRFDTYCDFEDYFLDKEFPSGMYNSLQEIFDAVVKVKQKFDERISMYEANVEKYIKYIDAGFMFNDILDPKRDGNAEVFLYVNEVDKYLEMLPADAEKDDYKKFVIETFKEKFTDEGVTVNHDTGCWVITYEQWLVIRDERAKEKKEMEEENKKYKKLLDAINK